MKLFLFCGKEDVELSDSTKNALSKKLEKMERLVFDAEDIYYLFGLQDAGLADAEKIIERVQKHGEAVIYTK